MPTNEEMIVVQAVVNQHILDLALLRQRSFEFMNRVSALEALVNSMVTQVNIHGNQHDVMTTQIISLTEKVASAKVV